MTKSELDAIIAAAVGKAVAAALAAQPAKTAQQSAAKPSGKSEQSLRNEKLAKTAFKKIGINDAEPHVNVFTFGKWVEKGFRPIEGTKAVKVKNLRLFHVSQVRPLTEKDEKDLAAKAANVAKLQPKPKAGSEVHAG